MSLSILRRSPHRDDRNGLMNRLIRSLDERDDMRLGRCQPLNFRDPAEISIALAGNSNRN
jgi:hypothetical protein